MCHAATSLSAYRRPPLLSCRKALERRGFVSTDHTFVQLGERDRRVIFVERTHDLRADGESATCTPYGCSHGGQTYQSVS
jgi:hypothetical protein